MLLKEFENPALGQGFHFLDAEDSSMRSDLHIFVKGRARSTGYHPCSLWHSLWRVGGIALPSDLPWHAAVHVLSRSFKVVPGGFLWDEDWPCKTSFMNAVSLDTWSPNPKGAWAEKAQQIY